MQPIKHTLAGLFEGKQVYVVPSYQRLYVWNREDQWEPLWSDVVEIANTLISDALSKDSTDIDQDLVEKMEAHFLGAVVLKISGPTPDLARQLRVIDGQQRLTTLQLLIAAAIRELEHAEFLNSADRLRELTTNSSRSASSDNVSYKIRHHRHRRGHDYERFNDVMHAALNQETADDIDGPMSECYRFYCGAIRAWLLEQGAHVGAAISALTTTLIFKLNLVGIYLDTHEKEHVIFETLNARGEPLTEWDKIKNYLLYKADTDPSLDQESFFEDYLDRFDNPWWRTFVGRGAQRARTDIFADYWLESLTSSSVAVRRVFREFQKHVDRDDHKLVSVMQDMVKDACYFERFEEIDLGNKSREAVFHRRRLDLALGAIWPLLLQLQRTDATQSERERWLALLESYFVRRMIAGYQARSYDRVALELLDELITASGDETDVTDALTTHLLNYSEAGTEWPTDAQVKQAVLTRQLPQYARRLVLSAIEQHLITDRAGAPDLSTSVQVEHIMPRGWRGAWPDPDSVEDREQAIETLGNLTLLNGPLNASISNASWNVKRSAIQKSDNLFLNRRLLEQPPGEWTEDDIRSRGEWMHGIIIKIWPRG